MTLDESEEEGLRVVCERARITTKSGALKVLDMGCGWGSFTLYAASHFPAAQFTAVSNSASQRAYIEAQAVRRGLSNVRVITADINDFSAPEPGEAVSIYVARIPPH